MNFMEIFISEKGLILTDKFELILFFALYRILLFTQLIIPTLETVEKSCFKTTKSSTNEDDDASQD